VTAAVFLTACTLIAGHYADRTCTPGDVLTTSRADVCTRGWATRHRHVTSAQRHRIFAAYGIPYAERRAYELDHLVSLELGGSNADTNLFPQPHPYSYWKDHVENHAHTDICSGRKTVAQVQRWIVRRFAR
jgi:hypothetical protein